MGTQDTGRWTLDTGRLLCAHNELWTVDIHRWERLQTRQTGSWLPSKPSPMEKLSPVPSVESFRCHGVETTWNHIDPLIYECWHNNIGCRRCDISFSAIFVLRIPLPAFGCVPHDRSFPSSHASHFPCPCPRPPMSHIPSMSRPCPVHVLSMSRPCPVRVLSGPGHVRRFGPVISPSPVTALRWPTVNHGWTIVLCPAAVLCRSPSHRHRHRHRHHRHHRYSRRDRPAGSPTGRLPTTITRNLIRK